MKKDICRIMDPQRKIASLPRSINHHCVRFDLAVDPQKNNSYTRTDPHYCGVKHEFREIYSNFAARRLAVYRAAIPDINYLI